MPQPTEPLTVAEQRVLEALVKLGATQPKLTAHLAVATGYSFNSVNNYLARLRKKFAVERTEDLITTYGTLFNPPRDGV